MAEWQNRPLDRGLPGGLHRRYPRQDPRGPGRQPAHLRGLGVTVDGTRDILGLWAGDGGEGAKYWLQVLTEIKNRGVEDVCIVVCDGLKGLPDVVGGVWPQATAQTCVVHRSRQRTTRCFARAISLMWGRAYIRRGPGPTGATVHCPAAACERSSAAGGAGDRGPTTRPGRRAPDRADGRRQRDDRPQRRLRTRSRGRATTRGTRQTLWWWADAGRGRRSVSRPGTDGAGRTG